MVFSRSTIPSGVVEIERRKSSLVSDALTFGKVRDSILFPLKDLRKYMAQEFNIDSLAALARISLKPEEKAKLSQDLEKILGYVRELSKLDTQNTEPTTHPLPLENVFRVDEVKPSVVRDKVLEHAPKREGNFFKVPKVIG